MFWFGLAGLVWRDSFGRAGISCRLTRRSPWTLCDSSHLVPPENRARICKRLWRPGIDSMESIPGLLKRLQTRASVVRSLSSSSSIQPRQYEYLGFWLRSLRGLSAPTVRSPCKGGSYYIGTVKAVSEPTNRTRERESVATLVFFGIHSRISLSTITFEFCTISVSVSPLIFLQL